MLGLIRTCRLCAAKLGTAEMKEAFLIHVTFSCDRLPKSDSVKMFLIRLRRDVWSYMSSSTEGQQH